MMADVLGAVPNAGLVERAACADGNPFMLTEFLRGLLDERAIKIAEGHASLISRKVPRRFESIMRSRLNRLAPRTRQLLETGAILGRSFRLEDVAEMLRESPGSLLAPFEEALAARVVVATPDAIAFHHDLVWRVVTDALPPPVRQALHRQAGEMLLARGGPPFPPPSTCSPTHGPETPWSWPSRRLAAVEPADGWRSSPRLPGRPGRPSLRKAGPPRGQRFRRERWPCG